MLRERNGFFAFEAALHVFPIGDSAESFDVTPVQDRSVIV